MDEDYFHIAWDHQTTLKLWFELGPVCFVHATFYVRGHQVHSDLL